MKGIVLAGGTGSRLYPATRVVSKQLLPVYDKPMIYYPISTLMMSGVRDILIISTPHDLTQFESLLGDGRRLGLRFSYAPQPQPEGLAQAFVIAADFIGNDDCCLILGDNILYGHGLETVLKRWAAPQRGAVAFAHAVAEPERYGVVAFDGRGRPVDIAEKPAEPRSNHALIGLYYFDARVVDIARGLNKSERGEYEITDVLRAYMDAGTLDVARMSRGFFWLDAGTPASLNDASTFIRQLEERQGIRIACLEEIAARQGFITTDELRALADGLLAPHYQRYLKQTADELAAGTGLEPAATTLLSPTAA